MITPSQLKKIIALLSQNKTLIISYQKSKNNLIVKEVTQINLNE